jgi:hypothetical protein
MLVTAHVWKRLQMRALPLRLQQRLGAAFVAKDGRIDEVEALTDRGER